MSAQAVPMKRTIAPKINGARIDLFYTFYRSPWEARGRRRHVSRRGLAYSAVARKVAWQRFSFAIGKVKTWSRPDSLLFSTLNNLVALMMLFVGWTIVAYSMN